MTLIESDEVLITKPLEQGNGRLRLDLWLHLLVTRMQGHFRPPHFHDLLSEA